MVELPLFPLRTVLFPDGLLDLRIFEARYLDLVSRCWRESAPFGVVALRSGSEARSGGDSVQLYEAGTLAELIDVDSDTPGILHVTCRGGSRFSVQEARQRADGLWLARVAPVADDVPTAPSAAQHATVRGLQEAIASLKAQGVAPFLEPFRLDDAGWVANRWCELLPISQAAKYKLMELPDPSMRLQLVDDYLRSKGVIV